MCAYESKDNLLKIGQRLQDLRNKKNMNQKELSEYMKVPRSTVAKWENGTQDFKSEQIVRLANKLEVSTDYLLLGASAEYFEIYSMTGLTDGSVLELKELKSSQVFDDDLYENQEGQILIDLLNEILSDRGTYELLFGFKIFRRKWREIQSELKELQNIKKQEGATLNKREEISRKIAKLQEEEAYLRWKFSFEVNNYIQKLLEAK